MNDAVSAAIAAASQAAGAQAPVPAVMPAATAVAPVLPGKRRSLADATASASAACDVYLQASDKAGMTIDKDDSNYLEEINVEMNLAECQFPYGLKWNSAGQVQYARSYDGIVEARTGQPWATTIAQARTVDPKCTGQYDTVEFVGTLLEDITMKSGKVFKAGTRIGHTTNTTGTKFVMGWLVGAVKAHGENAILKVKLVHRKQEKGTYKWGVVVPETIVTN